MNIIEKRLDELTPYENNPRINDAAVPYVANSIRDFGFKVPIIVDRDGVIVAGHTRFKAALSLGMDKVPCIVADDLTPEQVAAFRLADNKVGEIAEWDMDALSAELAALDNFDLGEHRLLCGDATDKDALSRLLSGEQIHLYITDPPYNVSLGKSGSTAGSRKEYRREDGTAIANDNLPDRKFRRLLIQSFANAKRHMLPGAAFYIWYSDSENLNFRNACADVGWEVRQTLIWNKSSLVLGRQDYQWKHEPCLYGWNAGTHRWFGDRKETTVIDIDKPKRSAEHPTMKPVPLFAWQIRNSSQPGEIVCDSFGGSGTTLIACEELGRRARLIELEPKFCDVIVERYIERKGKSEDVFLIREGEKLAYEGLRK